MKKIKWIVLAIVILFLSVTAFLASRMRIKTVVFEGNERVSDEVLEKYIFSKDFSRNPFMFYYQTNYKEHPQIPFIERYDVEFDSFDKINITVYEKDMIGCVSYMGAYLYFDKDGIVVESSDEYQKDITLVTGIRFEYFILDSKLPVKDEKIFDEVLGITQQLSKYNIKVDKLNIADDLSISLFMDDVVVELGIDDDTMNDKIVDLSDMMEGLKGLSGTLNMQVYDSRKTGYTFKKSKKNS